MATLVITSILYNRVHVFFLHSTTRSLLKLFQEIHYWERLMFEIPHYAADVYTKREDLRNLREHVLLVVRDYNRLELLFSFKILGWGSCILIWKFSLKKEFFIVGPIVMKWIIAKFPIRLWALILRLLNVSFLFQKFDLPKSNINSWFNVSYQLIVT